MKFGNFICSETVPLNGEYCHKSNGYNLGDYIQLMAIDNLYKYMGIPEEEIVRIKFSDLSIYDGEYLILPINFLMLNNNKYIFNENGFILSPRIIPVFLGITFWNFNFSENELNYLKKNEPIGCRDEKIFNFLKERGIDSYLSGCLTISLPKSQGEKIKHKYYFIDVPYSLKEFIPEKIIKNSVFISNIVKGKDIEGKNIEQFVKDRYQEIINNAKVVVTSRLHIAAPCLAYGIPVILVQDNFDYRYLFLEKYLPLYDYNNFININWDPSAIDIEGTKIEILEVAKEQILSKYNKYKKRLDLSYFYESRERNIIKDEKNFHKKFLHWEKDKKITYAIWGINKVAEEVYEYINLNYPNAKLVAVFDSFREITFKGVKSINPENISKNSEFITVITSRRVSAIAKKFFNEHAFDKESYILIQEPLVFLQEKHFK